MSVAAAVDVLAALLSPASANAVDGVDGRGPSDVRTVPRCVEAWVVPTSAARDATSRFLVADVTVALSHTAPIPAPVDSAGEGLPLPWHSAAVSAVRPLDAGPTSAVATASGVGGDTSAAVSGGDTDAVGTAAATAAAVSSADGGSSVRRVPIPPLHFSLGDGIGPPLADDPAHLESSRRNAAAVVQQYLRDIVSDIEHGFAEGQLVRVSAAAKRAKEVVPCRRLCAPLVGWLCPVPDWCGAVCCRRSGCRCRGSSAAWNTCRLRSFGRSNSRCVVTWFYHVHYSAGGSCSGGPFLVHSLCSRCHGWA